MDQSQSTDDLTGKLLIAMPGMGDPRFERGVVFICEHSASGSMGLIVNKPLGDLGFADLLGQLSIETGPATRTLAVHYGGPVENGRGFVLHNAGYGAGSGTVAIDDSFAMTATQDILVDLADGDGPKDALLALGYAGWGPGQVTSEILDNGWLIGEADPAVVFKARDVDKWGAALAGLGVDPVTLSGAAGRA